MKTDSIWEVLEIENSLEHAQILFSHIEKYAMGSIEEEGSLKIFIEQGCKNKVIDIVNKLNQNLNLKWSSIENKDWHLMWKDNFNPINIDNIIKILPDWDYDENADKNSVFIKPGMSFGTGHHGTTYLMIQSIIKYKDKNLSLLDLGSGSSILSIVAGKLGYKRITAVENDLVCKEDIEYNLKINNSDLIDVHFDNALTWNDFNYDIVVANIEKIIIKGIIKNINKASARFIFSGLLKEDEKEMIDYLDENEFFIDEIKSKDEWISIDCTKK